jgi:hypothetical protein
MTREQALKRARYLDAEAARGWPTGYDDADVREMAAGVLEGLTTEATTPELGRQFVAVLNGGT